MKKLNKEKFKAGWKNIFPTKKRLAGSISVVALALIVGLTAGAFGLAGVADGHHDGKGHKGQKYSQEHKSKGDKASKSGKQGRDGKSQSGNKQGKAGNNQSGDKQDKANKDKPGDKQDNAGDTGTPTAGNGNDENAGTPGNVED